MTLTPLEIRHKEFKRGLRGYLDTEVDEFLDDVTDEVDRLVRENVSLGGLCAEQRAQLERYRGIEETLQHTLVSAQSSARELTADANAEARRLVGAAEHKAREIVNQSYANKQALEKEIVVLMTLHEEVRFKCQSLLSGYLGQLDDMDVAAGELQQSEPLSEESKRAAASHSTDRPVASSTLDELVVAEPGRPTRKPLAADDPEKEIGVCAVSATVPVALLTATAGEALSSVTPVGQEDNESEPAPPSQPEPKTRTTRRPLSRLRLRRHRATGSQTFDDHHGHSAEEESDDVVLASVASGTSDEPSDVAVD